MRSEQEVRGLLEFSKGMGEPFTQITSALAWVVDDEPQDATPQSNAALLADQVRVLNEEILARDARIAELREAIRMKNLNTDDIVGKLRRGEL